MVPDMKQDPRFARSPMAMNDPPGRFYCGIPLITDEGFALGTLCVVDFEPRQISFEQTEALRRLSRQVLTQLELRRRLIAHKRTIKELDEARIAAAAEKARAEEILDNVLPAAIADELKKNGRVRPKYTRSATILFADFQDFTLLAERIEPAALIGLLDRYFRAFDDIVASHGLEKLKTIGDAYMAVGGVPMGRRRHPVDACLAAVEMQATVARIKSRSEKMRLPALELRIGIHTGPVISEVVGNRQIKLRYLGRRGEYGVVHGSERHSRPDQHLRSRGRTCAAVLRAGIARAGRGEARTCLRNVLSQPLEAGIFAPSRRAHAKREPDFDADRSCRRGRLGLECQNAKS